MGFVLTQSAVKDFEKELTCPARWKAQWVDKLISFPESLHMTKGNYFEWIAIGANAQGKTDIPTMPLLKNGNKSTDQLRIEQQAQKCKDLLFNPDNKDWLGFTLVETQGFIEHNGWGGTFDVKVFDRDKSTWILDLKLTGDLTSRRTPYSWGNDWREMDLVQQAHYREVYRKKYNIIPRMGLLVADYSPKMRIEFGEVEIHDAKVQEYVERFSYVEGGIAHYNANGWPRIPVASECSGCPLDCAKRIK